MGEPDQLTSGPPEGGILKSPKNLVPSLYGMDVLIVFGRHRARSMALDPFDKHPESSILRLPGRDEVRVVVDALSPECVREIGPLITLLKPGSGLQLLLVNVEDELVLGGRELEGFPRQGKQAC